ncbi:hypothetical protein FQA39_LY12520 [Lamprigera yunnana]|nr:hypothetical protein FQA39_LY12520 [Lamprigera yunnana]
MNTDSDDNCPIKSEVTVEETFSFCGLYNGYENEHIKPEPEDFKVDRDDESFTCDSCQLPYNKKDEFEHVKVDEVFKQHICNKCRLKMNDASLIEQLKCIQYLCRECEFATKRKRSLKVHSKIHTRRQSNFKTNLKSSLKSRLEIKKAAQYFCNDCTFKTKDKCNLKAHCKIHKVDLAELIILSLFDDTDDIINSVIPILMD